MQGAAGCALDVLPSPEAEEDRAAAAPADACPGLERSGAHGGLRGAVLGTHDVPDSGREPGGPRAPRPAQPPEPSEARGRGPRAQRGVVLGRHPASWTAEGTVLLPLRDPGHLQPLRHRMDGGGAGDRRPGRTPDRGVLPQARRPAPGAHPPFGSRISHDGQVHGATAGRPGRHAIAEPSPAGSPTSRRRRSSAGRSSRGTTPSTGMAASACSPPPRSTSAMPPR